jgi:hypothetical protein
MAHLIIATFWLIVVIVVLSWHWLHPEQQVVPILHFNIWLAVSLAFVFAAYNVVRWWSIRTSRVSRSFDLRRSAAPRREQPPDPTFNFTDEPPARAEDRDSR